MEGVNITSDEMTRYLEPYFNSPFVGWHYNPGQVVDVATQAEHISVLYDLSEGETKYVSWETCYGVGTLVMETLKGICKWSFESR
jgi:hypothetical protein